MEGGNYFSAASIEAILFYQLKQIDPKRLEEVKSSSDKKNLNEWTLPSYIEAAEKLKLISKDIYHIALVVKDYRNLIHPGRVEKLKQECDRGTAHTGVGALYKLITSLQNKAS